MAAYCTLEDLVKLLPEEMLIQLTDDTGVGAVDTEMVDESIETAGAEIDGWCKAGGYVVPFDPVPSQIKKCAIDITIYNLYSRRVETIPETREKRYKMALELLKAIAARKGPELGSTMVEAPRSEGLLTVSAPDRMFPHDLLEKM